MPSTYQRADSKVEDLVQEIMEKFHVDLDSVGSSFDILFAFRDPEKESPAMLKEGQRILGYAKPTSLKDKAKGLKDAEIVLDGDAWSAMSLLQKVALIDHQLTSLEAKRDSKGEFIMDDFNRPKLANRPHDRILRMFDAVARRNGSASIEHDQMTALFHDGGTVYLPAPSLVKEAMDAECESLKGEMDGILKKNNATMSISVDGGEPIEMTEGQFHAAIKKKVQS